MKIRLAYLACCVIWGSTWMFIALGLRDLPPLTFAALRMALAALLLLPFALRAGLAALPLVGARRIGAVGLLQIGIPYALLFAAQRWIPSGLTAVLFASFPVWLALVARAMLPDHALTPRKLAAACLGVAGVAVLQLPALRGQNLPLQAPLGGALVLAASVIVAFANVFTRRDLRPYPPIAVAFLQVASGALLLALLALVLERGRPLSFTPTALLALVYLAVFGTAVTYLFLFWLIPRVPLVAIGAIPLLDTMVAVTLGTVVLGERVGWPLLVGGALVLCGAFLANLPAPEATPPSTAPGGTTR